jgi:hypothetical protein
MKKTEEKDLNNIKFAYSIIERKLTGLNQVYATLTNKINYLFAFVGVTTAVYIQIVHTIAAQHRNILTYFPFFLSILSLWFLYDAAKKRTFYDPPHQDLVFSKEYLEMETVQFINKTTANMHKGYKKNLKPLSEVSESVNSATIVAIANIVSIIFIGLL